MDLKLQLGSALVTCALLASCSSDSTPPSGSGGSAGTSTTGGTSVGGGSSSGGSSTGGNATGGSGTGGSSTGGKGGSVTGGAGTGGSSTGGAGTGGTAGGSGPTVGGCNVFPNNDAWNQDVSALPADAGWTSKIAALVGNINLHPDYGNSGSDSYGIPYNLVPETQPQVPIVFDDYPDESDPGPYPFPGPDTIKIEGQNPTSCSGDCHVLVVQQGVCKLFEGYACESRSGAWHCANGATWDLNRVGYGQRKAGFTSADAAGLAIFPGVLRYAEATAGEIRHAIRFTLNCTTNRYIAPATHYAVPKGCKADNPNAPPMGLRVRLKANFDTSTFSGAPLAVLKAMQKYGLILADNGSNFYFQGELNSGWNEADVEPLKKVPASAFEVVKTEGL